RSAAVREGPTGYKRHTARGQSRGHFAALFRSWIPERSRRALPGAAIRRAGGASSSRRSKPPSRRAESAHAGRARDRASARRGRETEGHGLLLVAEEHEVIGADLAREGGVARVEVARGRAAHEPDRDLL